MRAEVRAEHREVAVVQPFRSTPFVRPKAVGLLAAGGVVVWLIASAAPLIGVGAEGAGPSTWTNDLTPITPADWDAGKAARTSWPGGFGRATLRSSVASRTTGSCSTRERCSPKRTMPSLARFGRPSRRVGPACSLLGIQVREPVLHGNTVDLCRVFTAVTAERC